MKKRALTLLATLTLLAGGLSLASAADPTSVSRSGLATCTTDNGGRCTLAHNLATVPTVVTLTPSIPIGSPIYTLSVVDGSVTATALRVRATKASGGALAGAAIRFYYEAKGVLGDPTTTPSPTTTTVQPTTVAPTTTVVPTTTPAPTTPLTTTTQVPVTTTAPPNPGGDLTLPRVPWEGGPAYYERFPQAKANGWTNPSFFPISVWGATVETQRDVDTDRAVGINTYVEIYNTARLDLIRNAGMAAIHGQVNNGLKGNETVGWFLSDEPEQFGQAGVLDLLKREAAALPADGRMRYTNFTANMIWPDYSPGEVMASQWIEVNDAVSLDTYWYGRYMGCDRKFYDGFPAFNLSRLTAAECYRPFNYGYAVSVQRQLAAFSGKQEPVYSFIENGRPYAENAAIKPDQLAGAVWNSLIHGAMGINYFNHTFGDQCPSSNNFRHPVYVGGSCYTAMVDRATKVNDQIKRLAPVLNTQAYEWTFNPNLDTRLWVKDGYAYIAAMGKGIPGGTATGTMTLALPAGITASTVEVLDENRTLDVVNGRVTDTWAFDTTYHLYKVAL